MSDIPQEVPLAERLQSIPKDYRADIPFQWSENGIETGHHLIPVGHLMHIAADEITRLQAENERLREAIILMAEDGWLIHGPEGMDETQQKIYDIYVSFNSES